MKHVLMGALLTVALPVFAQSMHFEGCTDRQSKPVTAMADDRIAPLAQYGSDDGKPVIRFNTPGMARLLPETQLFVVAAECGRQFLGLPAEGELTVAQAREADCWAVATLKHSGVLRDMKAVSAVEEDLGLMTGDGPQLSGPKRELKLATCTAPAQVKGSLQLPTGEAVNQKWNACVQGCGAKLFSCGRAASCQQTYDQCVAGCGSEVK